MGGYYERAPQLHLDGTLIFQTPEDRANETLVAERLGARWRCSVRSFGALSPVDWYAERHGRLIGILELKARGHAHDRYRSVFLNVRKWLALGLASVGLGVPSLYVIKFSDGIFWISYSRIDARSHNMGGCLRVVKSVNDIEPVIEIPLASLARLKGEA